MEEEVSREVYQKGMKKREKEEKCLLYVLNVVCLLYVCSRGDVEEEVSREVYQKGMKKREKEEKCLLYVLNVVCLLYVCLIFVYSM